MSDITTPHNHFFVEFFSRGETAREFVTHYLPPQVVAHIDLDSLEPTKDSFVDVELREHRSDLLFRANLKIGHPGYVYLLFEHKSRPDRRVAFQLFRYLTRIWEHDDKQSPNAPLGPVQE
jgi:predicted transposase/invertase (TIGR01784 family)